jgi:hypothetical protein
MNHPRAPYNFFTYNDSPYPVRNDLIEAYRAAWDKLAQPGNWWTGAERIAIANETRLAVQCDFCRERKQALSPYGMVGEHQHGGDLDELAVDAVHRIITDQGRITQAYIDDNAARGLSEECYVELLGIVVLVFSIDEFNRGLGLSLEPFPAPIAGEPDHYRPELAARGTGFVAMLPQNGATGAEEDLWSIKGRSANVLRALSLVPNAVRAWCELGEAQYLAQDQMMSEHGTIPGREIDRMQVELVAGRVSSYNECFY